MYSIQSQQKDRFDAVARLERLESFLVADPSNEPLLTEVFDLALAAGKYEQAERHLMVAMAQYGHLLSWKFRWAMLCIALNRLGEARETLDALRTEVGEDPMVAHNLAVIAFLEKDYRTSSDTLAPWMGVQSATDINRQDKDLSVDSLAALQILWLRSLHRSSQLELAWSWILTRLDDKTLTASAAGVASLIALDCGHLDRVEELARFASGHPATQQEVCLSLGSVMLARRDADGARDQFVHALRLNSADGRIWSMLGFAELQCERVNTAVEHFEESVRLMPEHVGTWIGLGWARLLVDRELAGAHQAFKTAHDLDHNFAESHGCLAVVLASSGQRLEAQRHIELADRLDSSNMAARYAEAVLSGEAKDAGAVRRLARRVLLARRS